MLGLYVIQTNYTLQKALGIISPLIDPLASKRTTVPLPAQTARHLFNAAYSFDFGQRCSFQCPAEWIGERMAAFRCHSVGKWGEPYLQLAAL